MLYRVSFCGVLYLVAAAILGVSSGSTHYAVAAIAPMPPSCAPPSVRPKEQPAGFDRRRRSITQRVAFGDAYVNGRCVRFDYSGAADVHVIVLGDGGTIRIYYDVPKAFTASTVRDTALLSLTDSKAMNNDTDDRLQLSVLASDRLIFEADVTPLGVCAVFPKQRLSCEATPAEKKDGWAGMLTVDLHRFLRPTTDVTWRFAAALHRLDPGADEALQPSPPGTELTDLDVVTIPHDSCPVAPLDTRYVTICTRYDFDANGYGFVPSYGTLQAFDPKEQTEQRYGADAERAFGIGSRVAVAGALLHAEKPSVNYAASTLLGIKPNVTPGFNATDKELFELLQLSQSAPQPLSDGLSRFGSDVVPFQLGNIPRTDAGVKLALRAHSPDVDTDPDRDNEWLSSLGLLAYRSTGDSETSDASDIAATITATHKTSDSNLTIALSDIITSGTKKTVDFLQGPFSTMNLGGGVSVRFPLEASRPLHGDDIASQLTYSNSKYHLGTLLRAIEDASAGATDLFGAETWSHSSKALIPGKLAIRSATTSAVIGWRDTDKGFYTRLGPSQPLRGTRGPFYQVTQNLDDFGDRHAIKRAIAFGQNRWFSDAGIEQFASRLDVSQESGPFTYTVSGTRSSSTLRLLTQAQVDAFVPETQPQLSRVDRAEAAIEWHPTKFRLRVGAASANETDCGNGAPPRPQPTPVPGTVILTCEGAITHGTVTILSGGTIGNLEIVGSYGTSSRESGAPLVSGRIERLASLRWHWNRCNKLSVDSINRSGFDVLKDTAGNELTGTLEVHPGILAGGYSPVLRVAYSRSTTIPLFGNPNSSEPKFSISFLDLFHKVDDDGC
jgi:hypothetical protein